MTNRQRVVLAIVLVLLLTGASLLQAQENQGEWEALAREVVGLYGAGHFDRAVPLAMKALYMAEEALGPDHPDVATSLNNLASLYQAQGQNRMER